MFFDVGNLSRTYDLHQAFFSLSLDNMLLEAFYGKLRSICEEIALSEPITSDISAMKKQRYSMWVACFLYALSSSCDGVRSQIHGAKELPSLMGPYAPPTVSLVTVAIMAVTVAMIPVVASVSHFEDSMVSIFAEEYQRVLVAESSTTATLAQTGASVACVATNIPWIIDSNASNHMTGTASILFDVSTSRCLPRVTLEDGSTSQIDGLGTANLSSLSSSLSLPSDLQRGKKIGGGSKHSGLNYFDADIPPSTALRSAIDPSQLHCSLGHPSLQNLIKLVPSCQSLPCEESLLGTLPFSYLVNRMPSTVLGGQIPHYKLFPDCHLYTLALRVFGCTCYVHALDPGHDKLDPRAIKCVFLGDPSIYLPTRVPSVFSIPSSTVKPLQVYVRRNKVVTAPAPIPLASATSGDSSPMSSLVLVLSPMPASFVAPDIDSLPLLSVRMTALHDNGTWEIVPLSSGKSFVGCQWVFTMKYLLDGTIEHHKACLIPKGYTPTYGIDYVETFSPMAKIGFQSNHSVFYSITKRGRILLIVHVDDIIITGDDTQVCNGHFRGNKLDGNPPMDSSVKLCVDQFGVIRQFIFAPRSTHMEAALRIVRYLNVHPGHGFFYEVNGHLLVEAFNDSD
ncbi:hypothetical protein Acr_06g0007750 [Actinidia rufa]|uniref:Retroviral polymerase SH3-like domain-containing protein n=1 Tax=Actinidia rufa TaxID=165716 RepID=A0A7J0EQR4_9ERIC|nr:hypothetical protein Acr_06g0007750 [Actinidia rufa]